MAKLKEETNKPKTTFVEKSNNIGAETSIFDEKKLMKMQQAKEKKVKIKSSIADIIPIVDMTANGYFEFRNRQEYMEILQLTSKDIYSLNEEDKNHDIYSFAFFLQSYLDDLKIVPLNFPVDTSVQQRFIQRKIERTKNPIYIPFLQKKLQELQFIESNRTNREYYLFVYGDNEYTLTNKVNQIERLLQRTTPIIRLSDDKKINILYKLFNLNSKNKK